MKIRFYSDYVLWGVETQDGTTDEYRVDIPRGFPFDEGLVVFKTHAYTPVKDGNLNTYTFHWDNIRFDGPVVGKYSVFEASDVVYLQRNGDRPIGDTQTVYITIPSADDLINPVLFGQVHQALRGQVLLSINGGPNQVINPFGYDFDDCVSDDWQSFRVELDPSDLQAGVNSFKWTVGTRDACANAYGPWSLLVLGRLLYQISSNPSFLIGDLVALGTSVSNNSEWHL